jgi:hypothetical protein
MRSVSGTKSLTKGIWLLIGLTLAPPVAAEQQRVGNLFVEYPSRFQYQAVASEQSLGNVKRQLGQRIESLEIYEAPPSCGLGEVRIVRARYTSGMAMDLDHASRETVRKLAQLEGVQNLRHSVQRVVLSGRDARVISVEADRWSGRVFVETLVIYDAHAATLWNVQAIGGKKKSVNPFATARIDDERNCARSILSSVSLS